MFSKKPRLFVSKANPPTISHPCDIVVSPEFYWMVKKRLPVKYTWQARSLIGSIFDGLLPEGEYEYKIKKDGDTFTIFAYDHRFILKTLRDIGIDSGLIHQVYFAQNELDITKAYDLGTSAMFAQEEQLVVVPKVLLQTDTHALQTPTPSQRSSVRFALEKHNLPITKKAMQFIMVFLMLWIGLVALEAIHTKRALDRLIVDEMALYETYNMPKTSLQLNSIRQSLESQSQKQQALRQAADTFINQSLKSQDALTSLEIDNNSINALLTQPQSRFSTFSSTLEQQFSQASLLRKDANTTQVELRYE